MNSRGLAPSPAQRVGAALPAALVFPSGKAQEPRTSRCPAVPSVRPTRVKAYSIDRQFDVS